MKSFLQGKKCLSVEPLRLPPSLTPHDGMKSASPRRSSGAGHAPTAAGAQVEVVKEGDKVVRLIVTCICGERVEVECLYAAGK